MKLVYGATALACLCISSFAHATFLPENDLYLEDNMFSPNMTEAKFVAIIDKVTDSYKDIVKAQGGNLSVNKLWTNSTVNASAQQSGKSWILNMYGGLARRGEITDDGFAGVVCHELGHHLGGFYFYDRSGWASSEGQSDYFATQACLPRIWEKELEENAKHKDTVDPIAKAKCDQVYQTEDKRNLCYRLADAGQSLATLLGVLGGTGAPKYSTPDTKVVTATSTSHPAAQCRLDTYFAASLCTIPFDPGIIPGRNHPKGQNSLDAEKLAIKYSCHSAAGYTIGVRPLCWFKPGVTNLEPLVD